MNPLAFIPAGLQVYARIASLVLLVTLGFGMAWTIKGWKDGATIADLKALHAQAIAEATQKALQAQRKADADHAALTSQIAAIDAANHDNFVRFEHENDRLAAGADAGSVRVRVIGASCPSPGGLPQAPAAAGVDSGVGAELGPDARRRYFALRAALGKVQQQLAACQKSAAAMTGQPRPASQMVQP